MAGIMQAAEGFRARVTDLLAKDTLPGPLLWLRDPSGPIQEAAAAEWARVYALELEAASGLARSREKLTYLTRAFVESDPLVTSAGILALLEQARNGYRVVSAYRTLRLQLQESRTNLGSI